MFYKVNMKQIAAAGFNWERKQQKISKEEMMAKLETYDKVKGIINPDKVLLEWPKNLYQENPEGAVN